MVSRLDRAAVSARLKFYDGGSAVDIKPIETIYKGYRFRSRLEARWAVFFDEMGWKWRYEDQGFDLPSGQYLPDFYFPAQDICKASYVEIKPLDFLRTIAAFKAIQSCRELNAATGLRVDLFCGDPVDQVECYINSYTWGVAPMEIQGQAFGSSYLSLNFFDDIAAKAAAYVARQARFEHGQFGAKPVRV